ncbi:hypothetical protein JCGZ_15346 [Jatropha curcas]|uniref:Uncharacterized protein n=1 Tax=Jatropha curcas TaxID=180498 RepID=A0A067K5F4_JATCU|nr:hypothetical protein JCGZ_15346 [Jatropha curcas]
MAHPILPPIAIYQSRQLAQIAAEAANDYHGAIRSPNKCRNGNSHQQSHRDGALHPSKSFIQHKLGAYCRCSNFSPKGFSDDTPFFI